MEDVALPTNNVQFMVNFVRKNIFTRFENPRVLKSYGVTHFCDNLLDNILAKYE